MGRVKEMLLDNPFQAKESMYNLSKRLLVAVEEDLATKGLIAEDYERDLVSLRTYLKVIIEHEDLNSRVQQS